MPPDAVPTDEPMGGELHDPAALAFDIDALPIGEIEEQGTGGRVAEARVFRSVFCLNLEKFLSR